MPNHFFYVLDPEKKAELQVTAKARGKVIQKGSKIFICTPRFQGVVSSAVPQASQPGSASGKGASHLTPFPGNITSITVKEGQVVQEGDLLGTIEAMKMEFQLRAQGHWRITKVNTQVGQTVPKGFAVIDFTPESE